MGKIRQCTIKSGDVTKTVWLDDRPDLRAGAVVTLKKDDRKWDVIIVGLVPHDSEKIHHEWSNNI